MSRTSRRGDDNAPAMFPFLAVLLCTIGALVLILVISVVHSHASAKREMDSELQSRVEQAKEESDYLQSISDELASRREKVKQEIERRRRELANVEDHITRLQEQWNQLRQQAKAIENSNSQDENLRSAHDKRISELRDAIDAKKQALADEVEKQKKRKPAFSIIPYDGPNGTSRRPVYLECRADGVIIQPEGIRVSMEDLKPPYGPGNPLDSALRVLRSAYQRRDATFGLTIPPYPLLVVRPDGIHSYAMARAAMSGWDDQFGYELVDADMDLVFPPGIPSLANDLVKTLEAAKKRQELLIASLPKQYIRSRELDNIDFDSLSPSSEGSGREGSGQGAGNGDGWGDSPIAGPTRPSNSEPNNWTMVQEINGDQVTVANPVGSGVGANPGGTGPQGSNRAQGSDAGSPSGNALSSVGKWGGADLAGQYETVAGQAPTAMQDIAMAQRSMGSSLSKGGIAGQSSVGTGTTATGLGGGSGTGTGNSGRGGGGGGGGSTSASGTTSSGTSSSGAASSGGASAPSSPGMDSSRANAFSSGNAGGGSLLSSGSASNMPSPEELEAMSKESTPPNVAMEWKPGQNPNSGSDAGKEASKDGASGREKGDSDAKPIAASRGKGWATSRNDVKATPVSRPIRIVALEDRWLVRKEGSETQFEAEIELPLGPQQASRTLEKSIRDRVDSWGLSLPGGYWCPSITVESASDAQQSVQRLQRLLEGSGVDIRVIPLHAPPRLSYPPVSPSKR